MKLIKLFSILVTICIVSMYFFPFEFAFWQGMNTKKLLAVAGIVCLAYRLSKSQNALLDKQFFFLSLTACLVSLLGLVSITLNNTPDFSYASYILSMWVWMSAAYAVCVLISSLHRNVTFSLMVHYLMAVCVAQCVLALMIDNDESFKILVDNVINQGQDFLNSYKVKRMYGIGASLDVAGSRFSVVLVAIAYLTVHLDKHQPRWLLYLYFLAFIIIGVVGNMIARTTTVGALIAIGYWVVMIFHSSNSYRKFYRSTLIALTVLAISIPVLVYLYNTNPAIHKQLRFAFEGFFNLYERGEWGVASNDKLRTMYVFPDNFKTWIIGDGYFSSPRDTDPYFTKQLVGGYYMGTDVGYLRFIFYFGLLGLSAFVTFMIQSYRICIQKYTTYKGFFLMLLMINFVVWFKVATDVFLVFALFITIRSVDVQSESTRSFVLKS